jgi:hypothetical protein
MNKNEVIREFLNVIGDNLISACYYDCGCCHGRCSHYPDHNYMDLKKVDETNKTLAEFGCQIRLKEEQRTNTSAKASWEFIIDEGHKCSIDEWGYLEYKT